MSELTESNDNPYAEVVGHLLDAVGKISLAAKAFGINRTDDPDAEIFLPGASDHILAAVACVGQVITKPGTDARTKIAAAVANASLCITHGDMLHNDYAAARAATRVKARAEIDGREVCISHEYASTAAAWWFTDGPPDAHAVKEFSDIPRLDDGPQDAKTDSDEDFCDMPKLTDIDDDGLQDAKAVPDNSAQDAQAVSDAKAVPEMPKLIPNVPLSILPHVVASKAPPVPALSPDVPVDPSLADEATEAATGAGIGISSERWYVVTVGKEVGIFSSCLLAQPLVMRVSGGNMFKANSEVEAREAFEEAWRHNRVKVVR